MLTNITNIDSYKERFKGKSSYIKRGFTKMPNAIILNQSINKNGKLVYMVLRMHRFNKDYCFPSLSLLKKETGLSRNSIIKGIKLLELSEYLITKKTRGKVNNYYLK